MQRLVSAAGFRLKGGGWYETDFKKDGKRNLHDSHRGEKPAGESKESPVKESAKPAGAKKAVSETPAAKPGAA